MARTLMLAGLLLVASCRERVVPGVANTTAAADTTPVGLESCAGEVRLVLLPVPSWLFALLPQV